MVAVWAASCATMSFRALMSESVVLNVTVCPPRVVERTPDAMAAFRLSMSACVTAMVVPDLRNDRHHRGWGAKSVCGTISEKEKTFFLQKVF